MTTAMKTGLAVSAILLAAAAALYWLARQSDPADYARAGDDIRQIRQLATEWSVETARARSDPMGDYDALAAFIPEVARHKNALLATVRDTPAMPERLANDAYAFASALEAKEERIERFKTANSVIRNSVRYLPNAAAGIARSATDPALAGDAIALADGLGRFAASPTDEAKGRLTAILDRLDERRDAMAGDDAGAFANFLSHARILLDRQGPTEQIYRQATSGEVGDLAAELAAGFDAQAAALSRQAELYTYGLWAAGGALVLVWVFVAAVRSRPAPQQQAADPLDGAVADAVAALPAPAAAAANGSAVHHDHADVALSAPEAQAAQAAQKALVAQRILNEVVGSGIARAVRELPVNGADEAAGEVERIAALAERFADASAARDARYDLVDLKDCADAALAAAHAADGATVVTEFGDTPQVFACRDELSLMLEQVVDNAVAAIEEKGLGHDEGEIRIATAGDGGDASITIIDNGVGIAAEDREHMFEPFAGSRDDRPGVGLAITEHIVHKYGGRIAVGSQPGGGTVLRISLPGMSE